MGENAFKPGDREYLENLLGRPVNILTIKEGHVHFGELIAINDESGSIIIMKKNGSNIQVLIKLNDIRSIRESVGAYSMPD